MTLIETMQCTSYALPIWWTWANLLNKITAALEMSAWLESHEDSACKQKEKFSQQRAPATHASYVHGQIWLMSANQKGQLIRAMHGNLKNSIGLPERNCSVTAINWLLDSGRPLWHIGCCIQPDRRNQVSGLHAPKTNERQCHKCMD